LPDRDPTADTALNDCIGSDPLLLESNTDLLLNPEEPELAFSFEGPGTVCAVSCSTSGVALVAEDGSASPWDLLSDQILNFEVYVDGTASAGVGSCSVVQPSGQIELTYEVSILR
jgi:hypothetical protein